MIKKSLLLLTTVLMCHLCKAQTSEGSFKINGRIDSSVVNFLALDELVIKIYNRYDRLNEVESISIPVNADGSFRSTIKSKSALAYVSFSAEYNGDSGIKRPGTILPISYPFRTEIGTEELYIFEKSDSINVRIGPNGNLSFSGTGADKLNCQFLIHNIEPTSKSALSRSIQLSQTGNFERCIAILDESLQLAIQMRLMILKSYKPQLNRNIYDLIYLDAIAKAEYHFLSRLHISASFGSETRRSNGTIAVQNFYKKYIKREFENGIDSSALVKSAYYPEYLFLKEWNAYKLYTKNPAIGDSFNAIFKILSTKYSGELRDQLILICIRKLNRRFPAEIKSYIDKAIERLEGEKYKSHLIAWKNKNYYAQAFPFELQDKDGKVHRLSDYRDKIIIMDFWFTGCTWCTNLNAAMHTIIDRYKTNEDVVFISVSEDKIKEVWLKSVSTGKYTSPGIINLYTNGLGITHPLLKFYNFKGAPQQLIIGKNGKLISSRPPRPDGGIEFEVDKNGVYIPNHKDVLSNPAAQAFIKIIDDLLLSSQN